MTPIARSRNSCRTCSVRSPSALRRNSSGCQFCPESDRVLRRLCTRAPAARWAELREQVAATFARADALNLDRKQTILGAFFAIERIAR